MRNAGKVSFSSQLPVILSLAFLPASFLGLGDGLPRGSRVLLQEPPIAFPTDALPSQADCDLYLGQVQGLPPAAEFALPDSEDEIYFEIGAESCLLALNTEGAGEWTNIHSSGPVALSVDDSLAGKICASIWRERYRASACTSSRSEQPMTLVFQPFPPGEQPVDIVIVDPLRRLGSVRGFLDGNVLFESSEAYDQGSWIHVESWDPPQSLEVADAAGFVIGEDSDRTRRFAEAQAAAELAKDLPPESE